MAIIATITTRSGAIVRIHDDCMARGSEEERRAIEAQRRAAHDILVSYEREANNNEIHPD